MAGDPTHATDRPAEQPEANSPTGYARLSRRMTTWTTNALVTAMVVALGLAAGRQLQQWWRTEPAEVDANAKPDFAQGLAEPGALQFIEFGAGGWVMGRQEFAGDTTAAAAALQEVARAVIARSAFPSGPITATERRTLDTLANRKPVAAAGNWALFEMRPGYPLLLGLRWSEVGAACRAAQSDRPARQAEPTRQVGLKGRVVLSAVGVPARERRWTLYTFGLEGRDTPHPTGGLDVPVPPGATRGLGIRAVGGAAVLSFKRASGPDECMTFYNQWFSARGWTAPGGWIARTAARQARFIPQKAGQRGAVDIRFDNDGSGLVVVTP